MCISFGIHICFYIGEKWTVVIQHFVFWLHPHNIISYKHTHYILTHKLGNKIWSSGSFTLHPNIHCCTLWVCVYDWGGYVCQVFFNELLFFNYFFGFIKRLVNSAHVFLAGKIVCFFSFFFFYWTLGRFVYYSCPDIKVEIVRFLYLRMLARFWLT